MINEAEAKEKGMEIFRKIYNKEMTPEEGMIACEAIAKEVE